MNTHTHIRMTRVFAVFAALAAHGCGAVESMDGGDATADAVTSADVARDSGASDDALTTREDSAMTADASVTDTGAMPMDARSDTGARDSGAMTADARSDTGARDTGVADGASDGGLMLTGLPTCATATVTAAQLYTSVVSVSCAGSRCHDPGSMGTLAMQSAAQMRTNLRMASRNAALPRVTPGDVHRSYVMYKLMGQHTRVMGGAGNRMPPMVALSNTQLCVFVNWIRGGAM